MKSRSLTTWSVLQLNIRERTWSARFLIPSRSLGLWKSGVLADTNLINMGLAAVTDHAFDKQQLISSRTSAVGRRSRTALHLGIVSSCFVKMASVSNWSCSSVFVFASDQIWHDAYREKSSGFPDPIVGYHPCLLDHDGKQLLDVNLAW